MTYQAVVETEEPMGYRATLLGWPNCSAQGGTREAALEALREVVKQRLSRAEIVRIEVELPEKANAWLGFAGMFKDDPLFDQVVEDMESYRREIDADDNAV
jgi:predicted RNase H-like HicB family nuclease